MNPIDSLVAEFEHEAQTTRKYLERRARWHRT